MVMFARALYGLYREEQEGQGLVEYALIVGVVAVLVIVALIFLRGQINTLFWRVGTSLDGPGALGAPGGPSGPGGPFACPPPSMNPACTP